MENRMALPALFLVELKFGNVGFWGGKKTEQARAYPLDCPW